MNKLRQQSMTPEELQSEDDYWRKRDEQTFLHHSSEVVILSLPWGETKTVDSDCVKETSICGFDDCEQGCGFSLNADLGTYQITSERFSRTFNHYEIQDCEVCSTDGP